MSETSEPGLSRIPSITALLKAAETHEALGGLPVSEVTEALRAAVSRVRDHLQHGEKSVAACDVDALLSLANEIILSQRANRLRRVVNATGVILHTGLGRSVLSDAAAERMATIARGYCNLEIVLDSAKRGKRGQYAESLLCRLTGAEAAFVVNNNAAATMLVLHAMARGKEVIVSRGQLIEIGGSYRLPEVMIGGGAKLREVGTTNKTHLRDYEAAICDATAMLMHVHTSNYRVVGFSESPDTKELVRLAHAHGLPMFDDLGSGAILDDALWQAANEPTVVASLRDGADLVSFSGDKLLGGPQAGILLGNRDAIDRLRQDPMARALRIDKLTIAALEATVESYLSPESAKREIPILASLSESPKSLRARAEKLASLLSAAMPDESFEVDEDESFAGGGSLPAWPFPTAVVRWRPACGAKPDELTRRLRLGEPAVLPRIREGAILFDLRTLAERQYAELVSAVSAVREE
ncbi:MAG: L-seryl-tRNA(Sec) selenium transferase [Planctomycetota bacterium]